MSVLVSTHNPNPERLARTLDGLLAQTLPQSEWELVVVDNGSRIPLDPATLGLKRHGHARVLREERLGLIYARLAGIASSTGELIVFCDDDTVLEPEYLAAALRIFTGDARLGNAAGLSLPEFGIEPDRWVREFDGCLGVRSLPNEIRIQDGWTGTYPGFAGGGGGAVFRRRALPSWLRGRKSHVNALMLPGRQGTELTSGEDNHLVLEVLKAGWRVGFFPQLVMRHLIPPARLERRYLGRLNRGIAKSWVQVLSMHGICPWAPAAPWTVPLRKLRAYFAYRAWAGPAEYVRWHGACGHFEGRALIHRARQRDVA